MNIVIGFNTMNEVVHSVCWEMDGKVQMWSVQSGKLESGDLIGIHTLADAHRLLDHEYNAAVFADVPDAAAAVDLLGLRMPEKEAPSPSASKPVSS